MKPMPPDIIEQVLAESPTFRKFVASNSYYGPCTTGNDDGVSFHEQCVKDLRDETFQEIFNASGKIDAIKRVREVWKNNGHYFSIAFPNIVRGDTDTSNTGIGLVTAKHLVESLTTFNCA